MKMAKKHLKTVGLTKLAVPQKMDTKTLCVGSRAVRGIHEVKAKNMPPFGQQSIN